MKRWANWKLAGKRKGLRFYSDRELDRRMNRRRMLRCQWNAFAMRKAMDAFYRLVKQVRGENFEGFHVMSRPAWKPHDNLQPRKVAA